MSLITAVRASLAAALIATVSLAAVVPAPALAQAASAPAAEAAPAPAPAAAAAPKPVVSEEAVENPYGLKALWSQGDFVAKGTLIIMVIMSMGSWYIIFTKLFEQRAMLKSARESTEAFWKAGSVKAGAAAIEDAKKPAP